MEHRTIADTLANLRPADWIAIVAVFAAVATAYLLYLIYYERNTRK